MYLKNSNLERLYLIGAGFRTFFLDVFDAGNFFSIVTPVVFFIAIAIIGIGCALKKNRLLLFLGFRKPLVHLGIN